MGKFKDLTVQFHELPAAVRQYLREQDLYLLSSYTFTVTALGGKRFKPMYFLIEDTVLEPQRLIYTIKMNDSDTEIVIECDSKFTNFRILSDNLNEGS
jgi:hypothetical protein